MSYPMPKGWLSVEQYIRQAWYLANTMGPVTSDMESIYKACREFLTDSDNIVLDMFEVGVFLGSRLLIEDRSLPVPLASSRFEIEEPVDNLHKWKEVCDELDRLDLA